MMKRIMVCVTKQKTCQRLIDFAMKEKTSEDDQIYVIHVAKSNYSFLGNNEEGQALEFLYEKARAAGASLTVEKSEDVLKTLEDIVADNQITHVFAGQSGEEEGPENFLSKLRKRIADKAELVVVPANS